MVNNSTVASSKIRIDEWLVKIGEYTHLKEAQLAILGGYIRVNNQVVDKPGTLIKVTSRVQNLYTASPYVSRGGEKLAGAIHYFTAHSGFMPSFIQDRVCLDVGISTGGFADYLIQNHAKTVFGVDVGYGQVDLKIKENPNVVVLERINARTLTKEILEKSVEKRPQKKRDLSDIQFVVMDVSFISVLAILPTMQKLVRPDTHYMVLIKPQFEAKKDQIPAGGVLKDLSVLDTILTDIKEKLTPHFTLVAECPSPIKGAKGNQEFFFWLKNRYTG